MEALLDQLRGWAQQVADGYDGELDDDSIAQLVNASWRMQVRFMLAQAAGEAGIGVDQLDLDHCLDVYSAAVTGRVKARFAPTGSHEPVDLTFEFHGPPRPGSGVVPPLPNKLADYFLAFDAGRERLVYAFCHDYHQFGHAWAFDGGAWAPISEAAYRLGSCRQVWSGGYDPGRHGVVGWSFDGDAPVGVVIGGEGLTVLAPAGAHTDYSDDPFRAVETGGDLPQVKEDSEWDDLLGIFGIDRGRGITACLTELGVWELGDDDTWRKRADVATGTLPVEASGDRTFFGGGAGAVYDAPRGRLVFWINDGDENDYWFYAWDGSALTRLPSGGLPDDLYEHFGNQAAVIGEHPEHGVVLYAGAGRMFALGDADWTAIEAGANPPGASKASSMACDPIRELVVIGPGKYVESEYDEGDEQHAFYVRSGGQWTRMGKVSGESLLDDIKGSGGWPILGAAGGEVYAVGWRSTLHTGQWTESAGWQELVSEDDGDAIFGKHARGNRIAVFEGPGERLHALSTDGVLFSFDGSSWEHVADGPEGFGERREVQVCWDRAGDRIVVFGGEVNGRRSTDTFAYAGGGWTQIAVGSTRPVDYRFNYDDNGFDVSLDLVYDSALERLVRFGLTEVAVLDGDAWRVVPVDRHESLTHHRHRVIAHDPKTRETLIVNLSNGLISRFDVGGCDIVGRWAEPADTGDTEDYNKFPFDDRVFDPATRRLLIHNKEDRWGTFALDLGPAFDRAAGIGPRTTELPEPPRAPATYYRVGDAGLQVWLSQQVGDQLVVQSGSIDAEPSVSRQPIAEADAVEAAARAEGFGPISEIPREAIESLVMVPRWALEFPDGGAVGRSRLGGKPSGIDEWPVDEDSGEPLGFLLQVELPDELGGGGVAVFCETNGCATEEPDYNRAIRLTAEQLAGPEVEPPDGVPVEPPTAIAVGERRLELDDSKVSFLAERDPAFAAIIDELAAAAESPGGFDKVGGRPNWVQSPDDELAVFAFQVDFDDIRMDDEGWSDAGLFGVLYVFFDPDSDETLAYWQYT